ncbi:MAG: OmpH family outer membrane protein [Puniceicoccales bacterium]|jgi:Skp family chaperone for outer membrane proteins|nr:OmpH family outer membrane protein [Puniceicoccales bacterium]
MEKFRKITIAASVACSLMFTVDAFAAQKILVVDSIKALENHEASKAIFNAFREAHDAALKEFKEMGDSAMKVQEEIEILEEKANNDSLLDSVRDKCRKEAEEKAELFRLKWKEVEQFRHDIERKLAERRSKELADQRTALEKATSAVAKAKKGDIVINKFAVPYADDALDITQAVIDKLNAKDGK